MHYLLIPYLLLGGLFVVQFHARREIAMRTGLVVTALAIMAMLSFAIVARPVAGDSWRYYMYFRDVRDLSLFEAFQYRDPDPLYALLNWVVGQLGSAPWVLYAATLAVYLGVSVLALRRRFNAVELSVLAICMTAYPFFIAYAANGLRQGMGLACLLAGYLGVREGNKRGWLWVAIAPLWHSAMALAAAVLVVHQLMCRLLRKQGQRWALVVGAWLVSLLLMLTSANAAIGNLLPGLMELDANYDVYFMDPTAFGYQAGFRPDFVLFSLVPVFTAVMFRKSARAFDYRTLAGWMLSLYLSLNIIYNLFAFAPFADRFAAFSWWLMPLVVFLQIRATGRRSLMSVFVTGIVLVNAAMLQLYTGNFLLVPGWLQ